MSDNNYNTSQGQYSSPIQPYESDNKKDVSSDTAQRYLLSVKEIVNECIEQRIKNNEDIAKVYTAEIIDKETENDIITSITVRYNADDHVDISNATVQTLDSDDKFIKICTYNGVEFYVLHKM